MHQNYYFLKQLTANLRNELVGLKVQTCFSQNKDELVIGFASKDKEFYIRALLKPQFSALSFPTEFKRAKSNSVDLLEPMLQHEVKDVVQHLNERSFYIKLTNNLLLLFKMFGNRSNIVLFRGEEPVNLFHKKFGSDLELNPLQMNRPIAQNFDAFKQAEGNLQRLYPTFGDLIIRYLEEQQYSQQPISRQWEMIQEVLDRLENPDVYYLIKSEAKTRLSLLRMGEVQHIFYNPLEALNAFTRNYLYETGFVLQYEQTKQQLLKKLNGTQVVLAQTEAKLQELRHNRSYSQTADILMANLTNISPRATEVVLYDFYTDSTRTFKLKKNESPQKQAEKLYRKAKNQHVEVRQLEEKVERKLEEVILLEDGLQTLDAVKTYKQLKVFLRDHAQLVSTKQQAQQEIPFRLFEAEGFKILVGKSAQNNDQLTQRHAYKEDIWLHAKDVSGSHVVIKHQAGKTVPVTVLEKAAQLAAYYSKRKSDTLCPVMYTPKKWVRKPKGSPPGAVVVEREKVILVKPENPFEKKI